jgi:hypothetical protein
MRARIRREHVSIEFTGRGQVWNEILRPYVGGPEAPEEAEPEPVPVAAARPGLAQPAAVSLTPHRPVPAAVPAPAPTIAPRPAAPGARPAASAYAAQPAPSAPRTWYPPRQQPPARFEPERGPRADDGDDEETVRVEPSSDPATLYSRLAALPGRRSERDAVLAAVWFLTKGDRETTADEVEGHFQTLKVFGDVKVVPLLLKHVHRTKMLESGSQPRAVKLSRKGVSHVRERLVRD